MAGPLAAFVVVRLGERGTGVVGALTLVGSMVWMSTLGVGSPTLVIVGGLALAGIAMGLSNPAMASTVAHSVDEADLGVAGAAQQMIVQVGVTFGIQLLQTVQQVREPAVGLADSYSQAYLAAAVLAGLCVIAAGGRAAQHRPGRRTSPTTRPGPTWSMPSWPASPSPPAASPPPNPPSATDRRRDHDRAQR